MTKVLIKFRHGLGDNVQLQIPLKHIKSQRPDWQVDVMVFPNREQVVEQHCHRTINYFTETVNDTDYDLVYDIPEIRYYQLDQKVWHLELPATRIPGFPQSWPVTFINQLDLLLDKKLFYYELTIKPEWIQSIKPFINKFYYDKTLDFQKRKNGRYAVIHFQGTTNKKLSYFQEREMINVCKILFQSKIAPVLLDFESVIDFYDNYHLFRANIPKNSGALAALISEAMLFIGIDSGPLHVAACTNTPSIGLWEHTSPMYLHGFNQNTIHYNPKGFGSMCPEYRTTDNYLETLKEFCTK